MKAWLSVLLVLLYVCAGAQTAFKELDERSRTFKKKEFDTPEALAMALCAGLTSDRDKARAIFVWIAENITYHRTSDPSAQNKKEYHNKRIKQVYRLGKGVCMDYSLLYQRMAEAVGLTCEFIGGYAKTFSNPWESHAWNAVYLDKKWELLDVTWGAGYRNDDRKFVQEFQPGFFCTEPRIFLLNHYPDSAKWQLMDTPISITDFKKLSHFAYGDLENGIQDAIFQKGSGGAISLKLKIKRAPTYLSINMNGKDLAVARKDEANWTTLTFKPNGGQNLEVWGGEKTSNGIHFDLLGQFNLKK